MYAQIVTMAGPRSSELVAAGDRAGRAFGPAFAPLAVTS